MGREQDGFLKLTKQDIQRIRGREENTPGRTAGKKKGSRFRRGAKKSKRRAK